MSRYGTTLLSAFLAGVMISVGCIVSLRSENTVIGACLFSIGLYTVVACGLHLFTGRIGYAFDLEHPISTLALSWLGNLLGAVAVAFLISNTAIMDSLSHVQVLAEEKLEQSYLSSFILASFCGVLMFLAVDTYKTAANDVLRVVMVLLPVAVFILCGFEHCVANMFYFTLADMWSLETLLKLLVMTVGNAIGSLFFSLVWRKLILRDRG